ncbi:MAG TPA: oligoendopeptidase F [Rhizomicrobium sp.]|jgi:oligoendopeptidase F|nr:oligoendopeptidase F [Rhizomicrobium sp.]
MISVRARLATVLLCTAAFAAPVFAADTTAPPDADNPAYMWDLTEIYPTPEAWTAAHDKIKAQADALDKYKGTLGKSAESMLAALSAISDVQRETNRLQVYAGLKGDENLKISVNQERRQAANALGTEVGEKTAWLAPEILSVGADKVHAFEQQSPELTKRFAFFLDNTLRSAPHTLGDEAETVLAGAGDVLNQPDAIYSQLANGELPFPSLTLSDGTVVKTLDDAAYEKYRQVTNRDDRKKVFDTFWPVWKSHEATFGATLTTQVMGEVYQAKVRRFPNSLAAATFADNMPESVYRMLVSEANKNLPTMYRYLKLRKKALGITDDLRYYDIYVPVFGLAQPPHFDVEDAKRLTLGATSVYGPEYEGLLKRGFAGHWMNVYHHDNEYSGAYMQGSAYDVHPYLLLNYNSDYEALSAFAHEWGHAVHTLLDDETQNFDNSNYSTFVAETASISNEMLLNDYMVAHAKNKQEKLFYLGQGLELIRATFFRQTMFAEFQLAIHEEIEKGATLSGERMTQIYCDLLKKYHGDAQGVMKIDPAYCVEWAFIPHFYYGFYVYQYATSMAGAAQFTDAIEHEGKPARDRFIAMLKAGGSDYPYTLYKKAGLDMATPAPYEALIARMNRIMDQIEALEKK